MIQGQRILQRNPVSSVPVQKRLFIHTHTHTYAHKHTQPTTAPEIQAKVIEILPDAKQNIPEL